MILLIIHGLNPNSKLRSILEGCANLRSVWSSDFDSHSRFSETFFQPDAVYIRFTHVSNLSPKFYIGSASHGVLHREHSRFRKFLQLKNGRLVQAELALRFWLDHDNLAGGKVSLLQESVLFELRGFCLQIWTKNFGAFFDLGTLKRLLIMFLVILRPLRPCS